MSRTGSWPGTLANLTITARLIKAFGADKLAGLEVLGRGGALEFATFLAVLLEVSLI